MKYREIVRKIEQDGWFLARMKGSHRIYQHETRKGNVIIAAHSLNDDIPAGLLNAIRKQLGETK